MHPLKPLSGDYKGDEIKLNNVEEPRRLGRSGKGKVRRLLNRNFTSCQDNNDVFPVVVKQHSVKVCGE